MLWSFDIRNRPTVAAKHNRAHDTNSATIAEFRGTGTSHHTICIEANRQSTVLIHLFRRRVESMLGAEMTNVKKLRLLQRKGGEMERQKVVEKTKKYLVSVGDHINALCEDAQSDALRTVCWEVRAARMSVPCKLLFWICIVVKMKILDTMCIRLRSAYSWQPGQY